MVTTPAEHADQVRLLRERFTNLDWSLALDAMAFAQQHHCHLRKDGVTPEFSHQVQIGLMLLGMLPHLQRPQTTLVVALLHDVCEDYDVSFAQIETRFGSEVRDGVDAMTKVYRGFRRPPEEVRQRQAASAVSSVVKGADRVHNQNTMVGVFTEAKIAQYVRETSVHIVPMLIDARSAHSSQRSAYGMLVRRLSDQEAHSPRKRG